MIRRSAPYILLAALGLAAPAQAQAPLTLTEAIARARTQNPDAAVVSDDGDPSQGGRERMNADEHVPVGVALYASA